MKSSSRLSFLIATVLTCYVLQSDLQGQPDQIKSQIDNTARIALGGNLRPEAQPQRDAAVVNSASYQPGISPGGLATLFGTHLSPVIGIEMPGGASSYKGVSVTVGGRLAPLFSVVNVNGQEQINFQVPTELTAPSALPVQVNHNGSVATLNGVPVTLVQPGIFEYTPVGSSVSYAVVLKPDGSIAGPSNPASRGSTLSLFVTGLGPASPFLATGQSGPTPPATTDYEPVVTLNHFPVLVKFSGPAPGFIGLEQINVFIPSDAPVGTNIGLVISVNGTASRSSRVALQ